MCAEQLMKYVQIYPLQNIFIYSSTAQLWFMYLLKYSRTCIGNNFMARILCCLSKQHAHTELSN